jgi:TPR repeat protein
VLCCGSGIQRSHAADGAATSAIEAAIAEYRQGDFESAWFRFWTLASQGDVAAQFNLAQLYRLGHGIPADLALARRWYAAAAWQGHGYAQYNLGLIYEFGHGTAPDPAQARVWYRRAADQDIAAAHAALERLDRPSDKTR